MCLQWDLISLNCRVLMNCIAVLSFVLQLGGCFTFGERSHLCWVWTRGGAPAPPPAAGAGQGAAGSSGSSRVPETQPGAFWRSFKMKLLRIFAWSKGCFPCLRQAATCSQKEEGTEFTPEVFLLQKCFRSFFQGKIAVVGGRWGNRVQHSEHCNWEDF